MQIIYAKMRIKKNLIEVDLFYSVRRRAQTMMEIFRIDHQMHINQNHANLSKRMTKNLLIYSQSVFILSHKNLDGNTTVQKVWGQ